jgi:serine/threonine-protein kinase RsbW
MPHETRQLSVPANDTGVREAQDALAALCAAHGLSKAVTWPVEVSLDEVLANVVHHGLGGRASASVGVEMRVDASADPPVCELVVTDDGPAFDPLALAGPDTTLGVDEREAGGLGIALVRRLMDAVEYARRDGRNELRLRRRLVEIDGAVEG